MLPPVLACRKWLTRRSCDFQTHRCYYLPTRLPVPRYYISTYLVFLMSRMKLTLIAVALRARRTARQEFASVCVCVCVRALQNCREAVHTQDCAHKSQAARRTRGWRQRQQFLPEILVHTIPNDERFILAPINYAL